MERVLHCIMKDMEDSAITRNGNSLIVAYDHGLEHGPSDFDPMPESADPKHVFKVAQHDAVTALALQKGNAEYYRKWQEENNGDTPLLVKLNGNSNLWNPDDHHSPLNCSVRYAAEELDADAVGYTVYAGSDNEDLMFEEFRRIQEEARRYDLAVVMWAYPRGHGIADRDEWESSTATEVISYAARIGLELGADMVKCKYPGTREGWEEVHDVTQGIKTVMSGGSKASDEEFLSDVHNVVAAGGNGLAVGRNIFQRDNPGDLLDKLEGVIFEEKSVEDVL